MSMVRALPRIPGLTMLGYGYDVFASPYCVDTEVRALPDGSPLLEGLSEAALSELDDGDGVPVTVFDRTYSSPKLIRVLGEQASGTTRMVYGRTVEDYFQQLSVRAKLGGKFGAFTGSVEGFFQQSRREYSKYTFAELSYTARGLVIRLPGPAVLRQHLTSWAKAVLEGDPNDAIMQLGTHLVGGVVIGGIATLRQYSLRQDVTDEGKWQAAVKAQYKAVTTSTEVDSEFKSTVSTFRGESVAQTLGGNSLPISSKDDLVAWAASVAAAPAIVDFALLVPIWQLLEPGSPKSLALKEAVAAHGRRYQPGLVFGGYQTFNDLRGQDAWQRDGDWGLPHDGAPQAVLACQAYSTAFQWGSSEVILCRSTGAETESRSDRASDLQRFVVYGGRQRTSDLTSSAAQVEIGRWGVDTHPETNTALTEQTIAQGKAYSAAYGWGNSWLSLFIAPVEQSTDDAWVIVGGEQTGTDSTSKRPWVPISSWGEPVGNDVSGHGIASVMAWSPKYDWGESAADLHVRPVLSTERLIDVPDGGG
jgi:hypothetical protein